MYGVQVAATIIALIISASALSLSVIFETLPTRMAWLIATAAILAWAAILYCTSEKHRSTDPASTPELNWQRNELISIGSVSFISIVTALTLYMYLFKPGS